MRTSRIYSPGLFLLPRGGKCDGIAFGSLLAHVLLWLKIILMRPGNPMSIFSVGLIYFTCQGSIDVVVAQRHLTFVEAAICPALELSAFTQRPPCLQGATTRYSSIPCRLFSPAVLGVPHRCNQLFHRVSVSRGPHPELDEELDDLRLAHPDLHVCREVRAHLLVDSLWLVFLFNSLHAGGEFDSSLLPATVGASDSKHVRIPLL